MKTFFIFIGFLLTSLNLFCIENSYISNYDTLGITLYLQAGDYGEESIYVDLQLNSTTETGIITSYNGCYNNCRGIRQSKINNEAYKKIYKKLNDCKIDIVIEKINEFFLCNNCSYGICIKIKKHDGREYQKYFPHNKFELGEFDHWLGDSCSRQYSSQLNFHEILLFLNNPELFKTPNFINFSKDVKLNFIYSSASGLSDSLQICDALNYLVTGKDDRLKFIILMNFEMNRNFKKVKIINTISKLIQNAQSNDGLAVGYTRVIACQDSSQDVIKMLKESLKFDNMEAKLKAASTLAKYKTSDGRDVILEALTKNIIPINLEIMNSLINISDDYVIKKLIQIYRINRVNADLSSTPDQLNKLEIIIFGLNTILAKNNDIKLKGWENLKINVEKLDKIIDEYEKK